MSRCAMVNGSKRLPGDVHPSSDETLDRLTSRLCIIQKRKGHRAACDDTLLAWAGARARPQARRALDLGCGKGTVAMLLAQRLPESSIVGVEALPESHDLALRNARLNRIEDRFEPRLGDLRDPAVLDGEPVFDLVTGAPPFMKVGTGVMPRDLQRAAGRFELRGGIEQYALAAAAHLSPDGRAVLLMDGLVRSRQRASMAMRDAGLRTLGIVTVRPRPQSAPSYFIFVSSLVPVRFVAVDENVTEETLCLREREGASYSDRYEVIRAQMDCSFGSCSGMPSAY